MIEKKAKQYFRGEEGYNCAQAVAKGLEDFCAIDERLLERFADCGCGQAEGGVCGALFAAKQLLGQSERAEEAERHFCVAAGAATCRQIKKLKRVSCHECVGLAARLAHERLAAPPQGKDLP